MDEKNDKINGVIEIQQELPGAIGGTDTWTTQFIIGAKNAISMEVWKFFGDSKHLQCSIEVASKKLTITILK